MPRSTGTAAVLTVSLLLGLLAFAPAGAPASPAADHALGTGIGGPDGATNQPPDDMSDEAFEVHNALLRWGVNNESNNRGAAPGTFNFFSAGKIGNPGGGGQTLTDASHGARWSNGKAAGWQAASGNVRIEKLRSDGRHVRATWAGTKTDRDGAPLGGYAVNTRFSDHQIVIRGGTGTVDPAAGTATIRWNGDVTIVYYSGYSFFYVSDPVLKVSGGIGLITATLSGYASEMDDATTWSPIRARTGVVLADLGKVDLRQDLGFVAAPKYLGVTVKGIADQTTTGPLAGSFPQSFIDFVKAAGIAGYWYSSGSSIDRNKPPLDLAVSYGAGRPLIPDPPETPKDPRDPDVENTAPPPPPPVGTPPAAPPVPGTDPPAATQPDPPVGPGEAAHIISDDPLSSVGIAPVLTILPAIGGPDGGGPGRSPLWTIGALVMLLAALTALSPTIYPVLRPVPIAPERKGS